MEWSVVIGEEADTAARTERTVLGAVQRNVAQEERLVDVVLADIDAMVLHDHAETAVVGLCRLASREDPASKEEVDVSGLGAVMMAERGVLVRHGVVAVLLAARAWLLERAAAAPKVLHRPWHAG